MMYKERGKMFVVIRTVYNPKKGRGDQFKVCSFKVDNIVSIDVNDALIQDQLIKANVTESEATEFEEWFTVTKNEHMKIYNIRKNNVALENIKHSVENINEEIIEEQAQFIYSEIKLLKNKLRELGHKEKRINPMVKD